MIEILSINIIGIRSKGKSCNSGS